MVDRARQRLVVETDFGTAKALNSGFNRRERSC